MNAGQTCIAPDYVMIPENITDKFVSECKKVYVVILILVYTPHCSVRYASFYPEGPKTSESFGRIISVGHAKRLEGYLSETKGTVHYHHHYDYWGEP